MQRKIFVILPMILSLLFVAACGNSSSTAPSSPAASTTGNATSSTPASSSANSGASGDIAYAKQQIDQYKSIPKFVAAGPAFDAQKAMAGKKILSIPVSSANPFTKNIEIAMGNAAKEVGFSFTEWTNQGQPSEWVQGMNNGVNQKFDLIDLLAGTNPAVLKPQVQAATGAGIKVVSSHLGGFEQPVADVSENLGIDYNKAGRLLADWACMKTEGKPNVLLLTSDEVVSAASIVNGVNDEFKKVCPSAKISTINVPIPDWSTKIQSNVQAAIVKDPGLNYVIPIYDSMSQFVVPAITIAGAGDKVKIATFNGTPFVLDLIAQGKVEMDIGENLDWIGKAILDAEMRLLAGLPFPKDPKIPFYIWDKSNVQQAGSPAKISTGYGDEYIKGYKDLWQLK